MVVAERCGGALGAPADSGCEVMILAATDLAMVWDPVDPTDAGEVRLFITTVPDGEPLVLNATAANIVQTALELHDREAVLAALADAHGVSREAIVGDVNALLAELADRGILELVPDLD